MKSSSDGNKGSADDDSDDEEDDNSSTGVPAPAPKKKKDDRSSTGATKTKSSIFGFGDCHKLEKLTGHSKKAARGKTATIFLPIEFGTKGMSYFPVLLGLQGDMWWFKPEYFVKVLEWGYGKCYPGEKFP